MLVGREKELAIFERVLAKGKSALIVVTGEPEMGKSSLLQGFRQHAEEQGCPIYATTSKESSKSLSIDKEMTEDRFRQAISLPPPTGSPDDTRSSDTSSEAALILIDGYGPQKQFEDWFVGDFIRRLRQLNPARIVVVECAISDAEPLKRHADRVITLKPIARRAVEEYLKTLNDSVQDKMQEKEIRTYADALRKKPSLIEALDRLLRLESFAST